MLESERNSNETDIDKASGHSAGAAPAPVTPAVPAVLFQPPAPVAPSPASDRDSGDRESGSRTESDADTGRTTRSRTRSGRFQGGDDAGDQAAETEGGRTNRRTRSRGRAGRGRDAAPDDDLFSAESTDVASAVAEADAADSGASAAEADDGEDAASGRRRRRRNTRTRSRAEASADEDIDGQAVADDSAGDDSGADLDADDGEAGGEAGASRSRRRRKRRRPGSADTEVLSPDDPPDTVVHVREAHNPADDVRAIKGSTRLEAKKQRRREGRESGRRRPPVITESEFLARRESVERTMVVRQRGDRTQIAVLEDGVLVEHYVNRTTHASYVGNVYLGKVQNVLPSMEAAFVDIGKGRNAVLYAGEVNFDASGLEGQPKRIESALKPGQSVIVQVTKDPVGHKGARLTSQVSLPGRYLVYVPGASMTGISRKLPDTERTRLKQILKKVTPENAGVIVRTAAEGAAEAELDRDITRLAAQWENIEKKAKTASAPALLYGEPDLTIRVVRDVFNEDFSKLIVSGDEGWEIIDEYVRYVAPHLADRISRWDDPDDEDAQDEDVFAAYRIDEQLAKALERKVWLPSGGSLVIDRTEAMTVIDVNTGKFTGQGGNLEETVTRNNLEAAEEIVRQLRLRDVGGIVVIDFIDMVLEANRELVLRRLLECLARDRTKHQVAEVTSLGLVQMTRKRVGAGLLEAFSQQCECCNGRGVIITLDAPAEPVHRASAGTVHRPVPAPPVHAPANGGNGNGGSGNGKAGYGNGRRARRDEERNARGTYQDSAAEPETVAADTAELDGARASATVADANGTAPANGTAGDNGAGAEPDTNGGRRTRRSTSAGTAFATAVRVDDTPPVVPVVTTVPPVTEPAAAGFTPVVTGSAVTESPEPPVRRTRSGSAVARVTVVADPEPAPAAEAAPEQEPAAAAGSEPQSDDTAPQSDAVTESAIATAEPTADLEAPTADALEQTAEVAAEPEPMAAVSVGEDPGVPTADALEQLAEVVAPAGEEHEATHEGAPATQEATAVTEGAVPATEALAEQTATTDATATAEATATAAAEIEAESAAPETEGVATAAGAQATEGTAAAPTGEGDGELSPEPGTLEDAQSSPVEAAAEVALQREGNVAQAGTGSESSLIATDESTSEAEGGVSGWA
jgi:ribonuclease E